MGLSKTIKETRQLSLLSDGLKVSDMNNFETFIFNSANQKALLS